MVKMALGWRSLPDLSIKVSLCRCNISKPNTAKTDTAKPKIKIMFSYWQIVLPALLQSPHYEMV